MGCHTWTYANRKNIPENVNKVCEQLNEDDIRLHGTMIMCLFFMDKYKFRNKFIEFYKILGHNYSNKSELNLNLSDLETKLFEFIIVYILDFDLELSISELKKNLNGQLFIKVVKANRKRFKSINENIYEYYKNDAIRFLENLDEYVKFRVFGNEYAIEVPEFYNIFRIHNYPENFYLDRKSLEDLVFNNDETQNASIWDYRGDIRVLKNEDFELFKMLVSQKLDEVYTKYPDLIVTFG